MSAHPYTAADPALQGYRYAQTFVSELADQGVAHACICPGSRSTPLTLAFAHEPRIRTWEHVDERSAAFFALGMAKALRAPIALVCTSGTAAANFMPAIVEARYARVPLLVLTADRPHELRDTGALQSIDQVKIYGSNAKWFVDMAIAGGAFEAERYARSIARRAVNTSARAPAGPVHLNFPFREPLVPEHPDGPAATSRAVPTSVGNRGRRLSSDATQELATVLGAQDRPLIVCGPQDDPAFPPAIVDLAIALGSPVLADPLSQLRSGPHDFRPIIDNYDVFLRHEGTAALLRPGMVIRFGLTPTSKPLMSFLGSLEDVPQILVDAGGGWLDPMRTAGELLDVDPVSFALDTAEAVRSQRDGDRRPAASEDPASGPKQGTWLTKWRAASTCARLVIAADFATETRLSEPGVFEHLAELLPADALLYVGNSMPIRDLDDFFGSREKPVRIMGNRGVNGIDGVVSSALGAGAGSSSHVVLVIGDLSFYHDMNGLLAAKLHKLDATIILLNNDGGGIFHFLPQADHPDTFERYFGTPTGLDFRQAVEMYGGRFVSPTDWQEFGSALQAGLGEAGLSVIEVRTDRRENAERHAEVWNSVNEALTQRLPDLRG